MLPLDLLFHFLVRYTYKAHFMLAYSVFHCGFEVRAAIFHHFTKIQISRSELLQNDILSAQNFSKMKFSLLQTCCKVTLGSPAPGS